MNKIVLIFIVLTALLGDHASNAATYELKNNGTTCLFIETAANISVNYFNTGGQQKVATWLVGPPTAVNGTCDSEGDGASAVLNLTFAGYRLDLEFANKSGQAWLASIMLEIDTGKVKQFVKPNETIIALTAKPDRKLSPATEYFACNAALQMPFAEKPVGSFLSLAASKLQAFGLIDGKMSDKFATCSEDTTTTSAATTESPTTTTAIPTTTSAPSTPPLLNFTVLNSATAVPCLSLQLRASLAIIYKLSTGANATVNVQLPANTQQVGGSCGNDTQSIQLRFNSNWNFSIIFTKASSGYSLSGLQLDYALVPQVFPNASDPGMRVSAIGANQTYFSVGTGSDFYACSASQRFTLNSAVGLDTTSLRAQAFRTNNSTNQFYGTPLECLADTPVDNVVPIVVGASLAGLVIIVLIAYLIGRRRQSSGGGYQSV